MTEIFVNIAADAIALQADGALVSDVLENVEHLADVKGTFIKGLDQCVPIVARICPIDGNHREVRRGSLETLAEIFAIHHEPMAEVEGRSDVRTLYFPSNAYRIFNPLDPETGVGIDGDAQTVTRGGIGEGLKDFHGIRIALGEDTPYFLLRRAVHRTVSRPSRAFM